MSEAIRGILKRALAERGLTARIERRLPAQVWREAVGAELAARAQPTVLTGGVLHVLVIDHRWRDQLDAARGTLIARVNSRLGKPLVKSLQFGLAHGDALAGAQASARRRPDALHGAAASEASVEDRAAAAAYVPAAHTLPDELRQALLGATAACLARAAVRA